MKIRNKNWGIVLTLLMCYLLITPIIATNGHNQPIKFDGSLRESQRKIRHECSISVTYDAFNYIKRIHTFRHAC